MKSLHPRYLPPLLLVSVIVSIGAVLMLLFLGEKSLWQNEALSVYRANLDWASLWQEIVQRQANMGLYYILLHMWLNLGKSEFVVRSLSVIFALATVPVAYALGARLFDQRAGITAALLLAINAFFIRYAQEARAYSLLILLVTTSSYFFVKSIERPSSKGWVGYIISSVLAAYTHLFAVLVLAAHAISLAFLCPSDVPWKSLVRSGATVVLFLLPLALFMIFSDSSQIDWIPEPHVRDLYRLFIALSGDGGPMLLAAYIITCLIAAFWGLRTWFSFKASFETWRFAFLLTWLIIPVLIAYSSSFVKPLFQNRFLLISLPPLVILAAVGLSRIRHPGLFVMTLTFFVALSGDAIWNWYTVAKKEEWRRATSFVLSHAKPGDALIFYVYYGKVPFEYYVDRLGLPEGPLDILELSWGPWIAGNRQPEPDQLLLNRLPSRYSRVWLIRYQDWHPLGHPLRRHEQSQFIQESLLRSYTISRNVYFYGGIRVLLYEKPSHEKTPNM